MKPTVKIERLSEKTLLKDCSKEILEFCQVTYEEAHGIGWRSCALVKDFGEIWRLKIGRNSWEYFHSLQELLDMKWKKL